MYLCRLCSVGPESQLVKFCNFCYSLARKRIIILRRTGLRANKLLTCPETEKVHSLQPNARWIERIVRLVAFDDVASTLLLVWTGLKTVNRCVSIRRVNGCQRVQYCVNDLHNALTDNMRFTYWLGRTSLIRPILRRVGRITLIQSVYLPQYHSPAVTEATRTGPDIKYKLN